MGDVVWIRGDIEMKKRVRLLRDLAQVPGRLGLNALEQAQLGTLFATASVRRLSIERRIWRHIGLL